LEAVDNGYGHYFSNVCAKEFLIVFAGLGELFRCFGRELVKLGLKKL